MTSERLFDSFIPPKKLIPLQNKFLATPLTDTRTDIIIIIERRRNVTRSRPCWKNSSQMRRLQRLLTFHGRHGLQMSAHLSAICNNKFTLHTSIRSVMLGQIQVHVSSHDIMTAPSSWSVRKFAELPIYCQRQKCSPGNVVSGSIRFMQIFAGVRWRGGVKWEWGRLKWRFSLHLFTVFRTFYIHGHTTAFTWCDCRWPWWYFKVIRLFHIKFLKNGAGVRWRAKITIDH